MTDPKAIALESFRLIETGEGELAQRIIAPDYMNQEADDDPDDVGRQLPGPAGFLATSQWLRDAFSDLRFELHETVAGDGVVMAAATMTGEHRERSTASNPRRADQPQAGAYLHGRWWPDHPSPRRP